MKKPLLYILICIALILAACGNRAGTGAADPASDFPHEIYAPRHSSGFSILGNDDGSAEALIVANPWQGAEGIVCSAVISDDAEQLSGNQGDNLTLSAPAKRIVAMSSTYVAMLDALDATDLIVGVSGIDFIANEKIAARRDEIVDVGNEQNVDFELLVSADPDLVLIYGVNGRSAMEPKLRELKIPFLYIGDYVEQSPLGRAEWIVALGQLIGKREAAVDYYNNVVERYESLRANAATHASRPKVMINTPYGTSWFMPSVSNYMTRLISDAGGDYIYDKNTGNASVPIDIEEAYLLASNADIWLNPGRNSSIASLTAELPRFADLPVVKARRIYNNNARTTPGGGNDFYESGIVNPDLILSDLVAIFHPDLAADSLYYYRQLR